MANKLYNKIYKTIYSNFSQLKNKKLRFYEGFDFVTVLVDGMAIRFPKNNESIKKLETEKLVLKNISPKITFLIPDYQKNLDKSFEYYSEIVGGELTVAFYNNLSESKKNKLCKNLATFISQLHSLKLSKNISQKIPTENWERLYKKIEREMKLYLPPQKSNQDFLVLFKKFVLQEKRMVLTHGDLSGDNIIINKTKKELAGVIDFGDISFSDPIVDFSHFWSFGEKMVKRVVFFYTKDKKERERILEYSKLHNLYIKILMKIIKEKNKKGV